MNLYYISNAATVAGKLADRAALHVAGWRTGYYSKGLPLHPRHERYAREAELEYLAARYECDQLWRERFALEAQ